MTDEQYHGILNVLINLGQAIDRIEAAMLKREDLHVSNRSTRPMTEREAEEWNAKLTEWEAVQAGEQREGGE